MSDKPQFPADPNSANIMAYLRAGGSQNVAEPWMTADLREVRWQAFLCERGWSRRSKGKDSSCPTTTPGTPR
ncbi:MAG TPA: hypothetical protein VMW52_09280 [Phycisphaerae bacterium]|nr:hypothetical protein [Phycisphaerae bacterium]